MCMYIYILFFVVKSGVLFCRHRTLLLQAFNVQLNALLQEICLGAAELAHRPCRSMLRWRRNSDAMSEGHRPWSDSIPGSQIKKSWCTEERKHLLAADARHYKAKCWSCGWANCRMIFSTGPTHPFLPARHHRVEASWHHKGTWPELSKVESSTQLQPAANNAAICNLPTPQNWMLSVCHQLSMV